MKDALAAVAVRTDREVCIGIFTSLGEEQSQGD